MNQGSSSDEWLMGHLREYDGLTLRDIRRGELNLADTESEGEIQDDKDGEYEELVGRLTETLKDRCASS